MAKLEIIPKSLQTIEGKWIPETRVRIHRTGSIEETPLYDADNRLFDTQEEANEHALAMGRRYLEEKGYL